MVLIFHEVFHLNMIILHILNNLDIHFLKNKLIQMHIHL